MLRRGKIDPAVSADLEALDAALAGRRHDPEIALIADEVHATKPRMSPVFAARLEAAAAGGFAGARRAAPARAWRRPRLVPALGALAAGMAALVVGVSALSSDEHAGGRATEQTAPAKSPYGNGLSSAAGTAQSAPGQNPAADRGESAPTLPVAPATAADPQAGQDASTVVPPPGAGPRRNQRAAALTIATPIGRLQDTSDKVTAVTTRLGGFVQRADVTASGESGEAAFDLRIPTERLDEALASLSRLGHVRSRSQQSQDITAVFSSALSRLQDARAERQALLRALATATKTQEILSLQARLRIARAQISAAHGELRAIRGRANLARVGLTVVGTPADTGSGTPAGKPWTPGRALQQAEHLLSAAASVAIVAIAASIPAAVLALLGVCLWRLARRRRRELALDAATLAV